MRSIRRAAIPFAVIALAVAGARAGAQSLPALTAPVNDFAQILSPDVSATLDHRIRALQAASGDVVVVATVKTIEPYGSIEEYAVRLFEKAGIGQKNKHNGLLVVLAVKERRVRIEVGYGLEEFITDGFSGETIREFMLPAFRQGDYGGGLLAGTTRLIQRIADARGVTLQDVPRASRGTAVPRRDSHRPPAGSGPPDRSAAAAGDDQGRHDAASRRLVRRLVERVVGGRRRLWRWRVRRRRRWIWRLRRWLERRRRGVGKLVENTRQDCEAARRRRPRSCRLADLHPAVE